MSRQQLLLKQELTISQILRTYGKHFTQIQTQYSDGQNGRCAIGVIMSYFGWDGTDDFDTAEVLIAAMEKLKHTSIDEKLLIDKLRNAIDLIVDEETPVLAAANGTVISVKR